MPPLLCDVRSEAGVTSPCRVIELPSVRDLAIDFSLPRLPVPKEPALQFAEAPSLTAVLGSLSRALDLTEGQPMGHAMRACLIALRIADLIGLSERDRSALHLTVLLKDAGCSSNAARMFAIFGCDDITAKSDSKVNDWCRLSEAVTFAVTHTAPHASIRERLTKLSELMRLPGRVMDTLTEARCTRGANIALSLGLPTVVADAIYHLDEHWDGQGAPHGRPGNEIPLLARIASLAQTLEVFVTTYGVPRAFSVVRHRSGRWFDPDLVRAVTVLEADHAFWQACAQNTEITLERATQGLHDERMTETSLDAVCDAFAGIVDAKSSFTAQHSSRVATVADQIAVRLGFDIQRRTTLYRAALLHDLGKLAVPNLILDKPSSLTREEFDVVRQHPHFTERVLAPVPQFARLCEIAASHHEKLDGSGYYRGVSAPDMDLDMRVLVVADIYDALIAERPYRAAMPLEKVFAILDSQAGSTLDADCVEALHTI